MGIQTMSSHMTGGGQHSHVQYPMPRQSSWFALTLDEVKNQLGELGKPLGSMNLDELLQNLWTVEASRSSGMDTTSSSSTLQRQASLSLARAFSGRTVNEVWRDIERGCMMSGEGRHPTSLGETTLQDFLVKAGMYVADVTLGHAMSLDSGLNSQNFLAAVGLSPSHSLDGLSDTPSQGRKRESGGVDKSTERRLRRKIKNRESAARSRARKQAYHNELVTKVSHLEEEILKLKKEKEFEQMFRRDLSEPQYQLRRTTSF